jgi:hypothetical protein
MAQIAGRASRPKSPLLAADSAFGARCSVPRASESKCYAASAAAKPSLRTRLLFLKRASLIPRADIFGRAPGWGGQEHHMPGQSFTEGEDRHLLRPARRDFGSGPPRTLWPKQRSSVQVTPSLGEKVCKFVAAKGKAAPGNLSVHAYTYISRRLPVKARPCASQNQLEPRQPDHPTCSRESSPFRPLAIRTSQSRPDRPRTPSGAAVLTTPLPGSRSHSFLAPLNPKRADRKALAQDPSLEWREVPRKRRPRPPLATTA